MMLGVGVMRSGQVISPLEKAKIKPQTAPNQLPPFRERAMSYFLFGSSIVGSSKTSGRRRRSSSGHCTVDVEMNLIITGLSGQYCRCVDIGHQKTSRTVQDNTACSTTIVCRFFLDS